MPNGIRTVGNEHWHGRDPFLPMEWDSYLFHVTFKGARLAVEVARGGDPHVRGALWGLYEG